MTKAFSVNSKDLFDRQKNPNLSLSVKDILNNPNIKKTEITPKLKGKRTIEKWVDYQFESSTGRTPEFTQFMFDIRKFIKDNTKQDFELVDISRGHFYFSGFLKNRKTDKFVYFSCSDVRHFPNGWFDDVLIRTAEHDKDYTGGGNNYCKLFDINEKAKQLSE